MFRSIIIKNSLGLWCGSLLLVPNLHIQIHVCTSLEDLAEWSSFWLECYWIPNFQVFSGIFSRFCQRWTDITCKPWHIATTRVIYQHYRYGCGVPSIYSSEKWNWLSLTRCVFVCTSSSVFWQNSYYSNSK